MSNLAAIFGLENFIFCFTSSCSLQLPFSQQSSLRLIFSSFGNFIQVTFMPPWWPSKNKKLWQFIADTPVEEKTDENRCIFVGSCRLGALRIYSLASNSYLCLFALWGHGTTQMFGDCFSCFVMRMVILSI